MNGRRPTRGRGRWMPWVALACFLTIGLCGGTNPWGWGFAAVFALTVLVAGQPAVRRRRR